MTAPTKQTFKLKTGSHHDPDHGMCVMEAVSFVAGERFSDLPECAHPLISYLAQGINDAIAHESQRNEYLIPLIPRIVGTIEALRTSEINEVLRRRIDRIYGRTAPALTPVRSRKRMYRSLDYYVEHWGEVPSAPFRWYWPDDSDKSGPRSAIASPSEIGSWFVAAVGARYGAEVLDEILPDAPTVESICAAGECAPDQIKAEIERRLAVA